VEHRLTEALQVSVSAVRNRTSHLQRRVDAADASVVDATATER
jgi:hypothetical protein